MRLILFVLALAASPALLAQGTQRSDGPAEQPPDIARSMCDALAGAERERCLAGEKKAPPREAAPQGGTAPRRNCDDLFGPQREACLKQGGRIKAGLGAGTAR